MKMATRHLTPPAWMQILLALLVAGCGGGGGTEMSNPATPAAAEIIVVGKMAGGTTAKAAMVPAAILPKAEGDPITVTVEEDPTITATVGEDGSFTLRGLPAGRFTLAFTRGDEDLGTLTFEEVNPNQQITIRIDVVADEVVLLDEDRRGIGHSGVELEGLVDNVVTLDPEADSTFVIAGRTVIARPGVTAIRKGGARKTVEDVTVGTRVHVKGALVTDSTDILAYEIIIQNPAAPTGGDTGAGEATMTICHIPPGKPDKRHTITVGASAWPAHQAHGDTEGPC